MKIEFNYLRVFTQDYAIGKTISMVISLFEMMWLTCTKPSRKLWSLFGYVFLIKPKYSMLSTIRLLKLYYLVEEIDASGCLGDIVECGVWNGGAAAMMAKSLALGGNKSKREIWLFDSFEGLPPPSEHDKQSEVDCYFKGLCKGDVANVQAIFEKLQAPFGNVRIVKGWLQDTLETHEINKVALLHIDTDWYESVKAPLEKMYDRVQPGGVIVVDDFWFHEGCQKAVRDFLKERDLQDKVKLIRIDRSAVYFKKV